MSLQSLIRVRLAYTQRRMEESNSRNVSFSSFLKSKWTFCCFFYQIQLQLFGLLTTFAHHRRRRPWSMAVRRAAIPLNVWRRHRSPFPLLRSWYASPHCAQQPRDLRRLLPHNGACRANSSDPGPAFRLKYFRKKSSPWISPGHGPWQRSNIDGFWLNIDVYNRQPSCIIYCVKFHHVYLD